MSDTWDFYFCRVEDRPASIFVDMGIREEVPLGDMPVVGWLLIELKAPNDDGLTTNGEHNKLIEIEGQLGRAVESCSGRATYVGRNTCNGCRDFYFYGDCESTIKSVVATTTKNLSDYRYQFGSREDQDWDVYRGFLYPDPRSKQVMGDRAVYFAVKADGDDGTVPREVRHWAYFDRKPCANDYAAASAAVGYSVENVDQVDETSGVCVVVTRVHPVDLDHISDYTLELFDLAQAHSGSYDGWETPLIKLAAGGG